MELKSFKDILLKKAAGNSYLQTLIKYAKDDLIIDTIIESLEKMAEPSAAMGRGANSALKRYGEDIDTGGIEELRDALGHHISHYKGALKGMHAATDPGQKHNLRTIADQHLNQIIPLMHLAGRASAHSRGKMILDYPTTTPWESNYTTIDRHDHNGKLKEGTKDLGRRPAFSSNREKNPRAVPNYHYLEMKPHGGHAGLRSMTHRGGYPFEEIQLGPPTKRDSGQAYLPIEDVNVSEYVPHPFDKHPIRSLADMQDSHLTQEQVDKFGQDLAAWKGGEHYKSWLATQRAKMQANPEAYKKRGTFKPAHHYEGIPLQDQPDHARGFNADEQVDKPATPTAPAAPAAPRAVESAPAQPQAKPVAAPASGGKKLSGDEKDFLAMYSKMAPELREKFVHGSPAFSKFEHLMDKKGNK